MSDKDEMLARIDERLSALVDRYHQDREETKERYKAEREERNEWRLGLENKMDNLKTQIGPVVRDHQFIVKGGKWLAVGCTGAFGLFKGWFFMKDHLK